MSRVISWGEGAKNFLTPKIVPSAARDNLRVKKVKWPIMQFARKKIIISRSFKISGALIVIITILSAVAY